MGYDVLPNASRESSPAALQKSLMVDVYHSGDQRHLHAPFLLMNRGGKPVPPHPEMRRTWTFWKIAPLRDIAVKRALAEGQLTREGFFIQ